MHVTFIHENGQKFDSAPADNDNTPEEFQEAMKAVYENMVYENMADLDKFKLLLPDGSTLIIGREALQRGMVIFHP